MSKQELNVIKDKLYPISYQLSRVATLARVIEHIYEDGGFDLRSSDFHTMLIILNMNLNLLDKKIDKLQHYLHM